MATTLTLLKLPILPNKPLLQRPSTSKLVPLPSINSKLNIPKDYIVSPNNVDAIKPAFLIPTKITLTCTNND